MDSHEGTGPRPTASRTYSLAVASPSPSHGALALHARGCPHPGSLAPPCLNPKFARYPRRDMPLGFRLLHVIRTARHKSGPASRKPGRPAGHVPRIARGCPHPGSRAPPCLNPKFARYPRRNIPLGFRLPRVIRTARHKSGPSPSRPGRPAGHVPRATRWSNSTTETAPALQNLPRQRNITPPTSYLSPLARDIR